MKKTVKIRQGVFETNSSSTHSICIAKKAKLTIPESLHFAFGEFGWEFKTLRSLSEKACYLYTGLIRNDRQKDANRVLNFLSKKGIEVTAEEPIYDVGSYTDDKGKTVEYKYGKNTGFVDHDDELKEFLDAVCKDNEKLLQFLFSDLSFIITGNDNDDMDVGIKVSYPHDEYYKGN